jgi:hypothetical protein
MCSSRSQVQRLASLAALALAGGLGGCYSVATDQGDDTSVPAKTDGCADLREALLCDPSFASARKPALAEASTLANGTQFKMLGGTAVLVEREGTEGQPHFAISRGLPAPEAFEFEFDTSRVQGAMSVVGVFGSYDEYLEFPGFKLTTLALVCVEGNGCGLWGTFMQQEVLEPLELPKVPAEVEAPKLAVGLDESVCVYDEGLACISSDKTWVRAPALPGGSGSRFVRVLPSGESGSTLALTDAGIVLERQGASEWSAWDTSVVGKVKGLERSEDGLLAWGDLGLWDSRLEPKPQSICGNEELVSAHAFDNYGRLTAIFFKSGAFYFRDHNVDTNSDQWCLWPSPLDLPILGTSFHTCGASSRLMTLSPARLTSQLGPYDCLVR